MANMLVLNGNKDLGMMGDINKYIGQEVKKVRRLKSGLYMIMMSDGSTHQVPKYNLELKEIAEV